MAKSEKKISIASLDKVLKRTGSGYCDRTVVW